MLALFMPEHSKQGIAPDLCKLLSSQHDAIEYEFQVALEMKEKFWALWLEAERDDGLVHGREAENGEEALQRRQKRGTRCWGMQCWIRGMDEFRKWTWATILQKQL